jgi:protein-tyrosine phosphatase
MAEVLLRHRLGSLGGSVTVGSVGVLGNGQPASPEAVAVMAERGLDLSAHRSAPLTTEAVHAADLVLAMTRQHVREVCATTPGAWPRTFTLKELVRRCSVAAPRGPGHSLAAWLAVVGQARSVTDLMGSDPSDDVADPIGLDRETYRATAAEIDALLASLVAATWPEALAQGAA